MWAPDRIRRENIFKNVVMQIVIQLRTNKEQPKLKDLLKMFKQKGKNKTNFINKIVKRFSSNHDEKEDIQYTKLHTNLDRISTLTNFNNRRIFSLEQLVKTYTERRMYRDTSSPSYMKNIPQRKNLMEILNQYQNSSLNYIIKGFSKPQNKVKKEPKHLWSLIT